MLKSDQYIYVKVAPRFRLSSNSVQPLSISLTPTSQTGRRLRHVDVDFVNFSIAVLYKDVALRTGDGSTGYPANKGGPLTDYVVVGIDDLSYYHTP